MVIEELTAANARLVERDTALERIVSRNSGNSSMPPSADDLPGRKKPPPGRAKRSGRERGKQHGAPGSSLPWVADPDERVAHRPHGDCVCGADLGEAVQGVSNARIRSMTCPRSGSPCASTMCIGFAVRAAVHVVGFDETTLRAGPAGLKRHVLSAVTEYYSVFHLGGRDLPSFREFGILPGFAGVAVHDRYQNYYNAEWKHLAGHQACAAHLLRDFTDAAEAYPDAVWPEQAQRALRGLIHAFNQARDAGHTAIPAPVADPLISEFRHAIRVGLAEVRPNPGPRSSTAQPPGRTLLEFSHEREDDVLRFTTDTRIWPTNNISERSLRPTKTQQKISGRLTSEEITQDRLDIRSYIDTIRKHKADVLTGIRNALTGDPWRPPIPAPT